MDTYLVKGIPLATLDGNKFTNATVLEIDKEADLITVISDFGNVMRLTTADLFKAYEVSQTAIEILNYGGTILPIEVRLQEQIDKLTQTLSNYNTNKPLI